MQWRHVWQLGVKELFSLKADPVLLGLIFYIFSVAVYTVATGVNFEVRNAAVAVVDEDDSPLSRQIASALLAPQFQSAVKISARQLDRVLEQGEFVFVLVFPPDFERDLLQGKRPQVQLNVDASAMTQAGNGATYIQQIIQAESLAYLAPGLDFAAGLPVRLEVRKLFNPNADSAWFNSVMQVINSVTMLGIILTGAALIREREHGTIEHLLVMPVTPADIMLAKVWANGLVILVATLLSLALVVHQMLGVPIQGSVLLFTLATALYLFSVTSLGIMLGTLTRTMAQFGLLVIPVVVVMYLLSGGTTPQESMPDWLRWIMQLSPSTHYVSLAQDILYRGAGWQLAWPLLLVLLAIGMVFFGIALSRFRKAIVSMG
ncbi:ABC transporter permease [Bowmanella yangjiangensis]|uniref:ABC transporter permease n=1 Tax=Bowmanella yangjiangensis TaxID=2811230 RepID=A0ABS3CSD0_9ALTE|nr:ABC transporter permease [Bowmanella yangjiangensis]MBN7818559.1 ABC transporter permease [Bowmanella yangjiangensis]